MAQQYTTVSQVHPERWLRPSHLEGQVYDLAITTARVEQLPNPRTWKEEPVIVCSFHDMQLRLACNKTQALAIADIAGTETFGDWKGHLIRVSPGIASNNKPTIVVTKPPSTQLKDIHVPTENEDDHQPADEPETPVETTEATEATEETIEECTDEDIRT